MAVDSPTLETKLGILHRKNRDESHEIPPTVLKRISERCPASQLDGVLSRVGALASGMGGTVTAELVDDLFRGVTEPAIA
jgi:chromosomal replication initiation ATPase DnaA